MLSADIEASFDEERLDEAIGLLQEALALRPDAPRYRRVLAEALIARRRWPEARALLEPLHSEGGGRRVAWLLALVHYRSGRLAEAWSLLERLEDDGSIGFARLHVLRGRILYDRGEFGEAANELARGLLLRPDAAETRYQLARALVAHADRSGAGESVWRRALRLLLPHRPRLRDVDEWHALLGRVHLALMLPLEALRHLEASRRAGGGDKELLIGIASLLEGATENARRWLRAAVDEPRIRERCARHLEEIAAGGDDLVRAMAPRAGTVAIETLADPTFLTAIFGAGAEEVDAILAAGRSGRTAGSVRTRSEAADGAGRLFAAADLGSGAQSGAAAEPETTESRAPDRLHPQTFVDLRRAVDELESKDDAGRRDGA